MGISDQNVVPVVDAILRIQLTVKTASKIEPSNPRFRSNASATFGFKHQSNSVDENLLTSTHSMDCPKFKVR